jgi:hypothetical protein
MKKIIFYNIFFLILLLIITEILLSLFGRNIHTNSDSPIFISKHLRSMDRKIDNKGYMDMQGFRTYEKTISGSLFVDLVLFNQNKKNKECSIVIIGDSSARGDGTLPGKTWPDIFQKKVGCKIFTFAKNGWTSLQMFQYHDTYLKNINYDYLIVSIVNNDPDLNGQYGDYNFDNATQQLYFMNLFPQWYQRIHAYIINKSDIYYFLDRYINLIIEKNVESKGDINHLPIKSWGYGNWLERLYHDDVLNIWYKTFETFNNSNQNKKILYFFTINELYETEHYDKLKQNFDKKKYNYLYCKQERINLGSRKRNDWANLADAHPGTKQIDYFANCLENYYKKVIF